MKTISILGVPITDASESEILEYVLDSLVKHKKKGYMVTPNPEMVVYAQSHSSFKTILEHATISLPDGVGVTIAAKLLGTPLKGRITGVDFMKNACKESVRKTATIGLLGAGPGIAEKTADCLRKMYPGIAIVFAGSELPIDHQKFPKHIDLLFVAYGHPKQEEWISNHLAELPVTIAMGVGGAFDYLSGEVMRAPGVIRRLGLEWLFRLIRQPWRWKRQLALFTFIYLICKERMRNA